MLAATNTQVASRVSPRLVDHVVAVAISRVPPLAVVGLTLESGAHGQALGATSIAATESGVATIADRWAQADHREVVGITTEPRDVLARVTGSPPAPDTTTLGRAPDSGGYGTTHVRVELSPSRTVDLPGA